MNFLEKLINDEAYSLDKKKKYNYFRKNLNKLTTYHYKNSFLYNNFLTGLKYNLKKNYDLSQIPFLPARLFKEYDLLSIKKKNIYKTLYSSGTASDNFSKIYLDKKNAINQMKVLQKIFCKFIGNLRLPMLVVDKLNQKIDRNNFRASTAALNGFSIFANEIVYLLNEQNNIDYIKLDKFLERNKKKKFLIFGFTSNIYLNLIQKINIKEKYKNIFSNSLLIHGGGWKKMEKKKINRKRFNYFLFKKLGIKNIRNYYGLVEQVGSIFFDCDCGYFIASNFSDVIIRDTNFNVCENKKKGIVQLISLLPTSYPGHSILTEDIGEIVIDDKCKCYGPGTRFLIHGRLANAELRGCSNF